MWARNTEAFRITGRLSFVLGSGVLVQVLTAAAGIVVVRALAKPEYALYTLALSAVTSVAVLSEGGLGSHVLSEGGRTRDLAHTRSVLSTAIRFKSKVSTFAAALTLPVLALLLVRNGASAWLLVSLTLVAGLSLPPTVSMGILHSVLRLHNEFRSLQVAALTAAALRLALLVPLLVISLGPVYALLCNGLALYVEVWLVTKSVDRVLPRSMHAKDPTSEADVRRVFRRVAPLSAYLVVHGQVTYYLLGSLGTTTILAEFAALQRFALIFSALSTTWITALVPAFARARADPRGLLRLYATLLLGFGAVCLAALLVVASFEVQLLSLLGPRYEGLGRPMLTLLGASAVVVFGVVNTALAQSRGWLGLGWVTVPASLVATFYFALSSDLGTLSGVANFALGISVPPTVASFLPVAVGFHRAHWVNRRRGAS